jgi:hypothetical protein
VPFFRYFGTLDYFGTLGSLHNLASCRQALGDAARALPPLLPALESRKRVLGAEHPDTRASIRATSGRVDSLERHLGVAGNNLPIRSAKRAGPPSRSPSPAA